MQEAPLRKQSRTPSFSSRRVVVVEAAAATRRPATSRWPRFPSHSSSSWHGLCFLEVTVSPGFRLGRAQMEIGSLTEETRPRPNPRSIHRIASEAVSGYRPHALRAQVSAARPLEGTQKLVGGTLVALAALGPSSLDEGAGASAEPDSRIATNGSSDAATVSRTQGSDERVDLHYGHRKVR